MPKKKELQSKTVAITPSAYERLEKVSQLTGLTLGQLASSAIDRAYNPKKNPALEQAVSSAREQITKVVQ